MRLIKSYFSLKFVETRFTDTVSGKDVNLYIDCFNEKYLKNSKYSFFRVRTQ